MNTDKSVININRNIYLILSLSTFNRCSSVAKYSFFVSATMTGRSDQPVTLMVPVPPMP